jgi:hypothetical protein
MKVKKIIEKLCNHEISKDQAIEEMSCIINSLRRCKSLEFNVEQVSVSVENNHGYLRLKLPYQYSKMRDKVRVGDKVDVVFLP